MFTQGSENLKFHNPFEPALFSHFFTTFVCLFVCFSSDAGGKEAGEGWGEEGGEGWWGRDSYDNKAISDLIIRCRI